MKVIFSEQERELEKIGKRMDRLDSIIHEYLRRNRKTVDYLSGKVGCSPSTLWRYSRRVDYFRKAPLEILSGIFLMANASNEDIRYILGLPTGKNEN